MVINFTWNGDIRTRLLCSRLPCLSGRLVCFCRRGSTLRERTNWQYRPVRCGCHKRWSSNWASTSKSVSCLLSFLETQWKDSLSSHWWTKISYRPTTRRTWDSLPYSLYCRRRPAKETKTITKTVTFVCSHSFNTGTWYHMIIVINTWRNNV